MSRRVVIYCRDKDARANRSGGVARRGLARARDLTRSAATHPDQADERSFRRDRADEKPGSRDGYGAPVKKCLNCGQGPQCGTICLAKFARRRPNLAQSPREPVINSVEFIRFEFGTDRAFVVLRDAVDQSVPSRADRSNGMENTIFIALSQQLARSNARFDAGS